MTVYNKGQKKTRVFKMFLNGTEGGNILRKPKYKLAEECNLLTRQQASETFNLSAGMVEKLALECGAKLKIGRSARYKKDVLMEYIDSCVMKS